MPIPGMENLLPRQGEIKAARGWEPYFARPSLTQRCPCNFSSALGAPCQGVGRSPVKAGLAVASAGPAADQPLAPPGRACGWSVSPSPADGEASLTTGWEDVLATWKGGPAKGWALLQEAPGGQLGCWTECDL